jgi:GT2 family glycosyltransferase
MSLPPRCSVVLPTFDRARLVTEAVESILRQTTADWELIIVDDGSTDGTEDAVAGYLTDPRVRYCHGPHCGPSLARNRGIDLARGEYVAFLDSDDRSLPLALQAHLAAFATNPETGMTVGGYVVIDETGAVTGERRPWEEYGALTPEGWLLNCYGIPGSVMVRREWLKRVGGFDPTIDQAEDWDLFLRLAFAGCPMTWVREPVCGYRLHPGNSTLGVSVLEHAALRTLDRIFRAADLPPEVACLEGRARALAYASLARRAAAAGRDDLVRESLRAAAELHAIRGWKRRGLSLAPDGFASLLENLVADAVEREETGSAEDMLAQLPARWNVNALDIRRAMARVAMSRFFADLAANRKSEASGHLRAGLRWDVRWLANRAVIAFVLTRPLG